LVNNKKSLAKYSKILVVFSYLLILLGIISLAKTICFTFRYSDVEGIEFKNNDKTVTIVTLDKSYIYFMAALKALISVFILNWGCEGLKVFKPLVKKTSV
jgi:hypothetical protein